jgi:hypothetical protein
MVGFSDGPRCERFAPAFVISPSARRGFLGAAHARATEQGVSAALRHRRRGGLKWGRQRAGRKPEAAESLVDAPITECAFSAPSALSISIAGGHQRSPSARTRVGGQVLAYEYVRFAKGLGT